MSGAQLFPYFIFIILLLFSIFKGNSPFSSSYYTSFYDRHFFDNTQHPLNLLSKPPNSTLSFGIVNTVATVVTILLTLLNILVYKLRQIHESNFGGNFNVSISLPSECRRFSLAEILLATNDFNDSLIIGQGGFGKVYKGSIDNPKSFVAIKRLDYLSKQGAPEFWTEITMLSKFRHVHLVSLIGYCDSYNELILVYEYMARGSFADQLYKTEKTGNNDNVPPCWVKRLNISIGAARGLEYLHTGTSVKHRVIHRDVKTSNILLDENWTAKISDFGLSITGPANQSNSHVSTHVKGTFGYFDPEYVLTGRLTRKSDVYSFGVVLFELLSGQPAMSIRCDQDQRGLAKWAQYCVEQGTIYKLIDPKLHWEIKPDSLSAFVKIAGQCLHGNPKKRPTMSEVVTALELVLKLHERRDCSMAEDFSLNGGGEVSTRPEIVEASIRIMDTIKIMDTEVKDSGHHDKKVVPSFRLAVMKWGRIMQPLFPVATWRRSSDALAYGRQFNTREVNDMIDYSLEHEREVRHEEPHDDFGICLILTDKGTLKNGTLVAIKRYLMPGNAIHDMFRVQVRFETEINLLSNLHHNHLISLIGYCNEGLDLRLVYEYMSNGPLTKHIYSTSNLPPLLWKQRLEICIGVARGLHYLHTKGIIHRDVKPHNILLDMNFIPKVSGLSVPFMGLASSLTDVNTFHLNFVGSLEYTDPEYKTWQQVTDKYDVYSFGVVLIEILCARKAGDISFLTELRCNGNLEMASKNSGVLFHIVDPNLVGKVNPASLKKFIETAMKCLNKQEIYRPSMEDVLQNLELALELEENQSALIKSDYNRTTQFEGMKSGMDIGDSKTAPGTLATTII